MRINTNVSALQALNNASMIERAQRDSIAKLSSGYRITKASDDAAGLGIANVLRGTIRAMGQASRNADQASSVLSIAEGSATSVQKMLERMKELAAQSASDSVDTAGRSRVDAEFQALKTEIVRTVNTTKFGGTSLLNGSFGATVNTSSTALATATAGVQSVTLNGAGPSTVTFAVSGTTVTATQVTGSATTSQAVVAADGRQTLSFSQLGFSLATAANFTTASLGSQNLTVGGGSGSFLISASGAYSTNDSLAIAGSTLDLSAVTSSIGDVTSLANAQAALATVDTAIGTVNTTLGTIGSLQSRIASSQENLKAAIVNSQSAESTIRDLDMADEYTKFAKNGILAQAGTAMIAQANQQGQGVLQLLRG